MKISIVFVAVFYGIATLLGWALATYWGEFNVLLWKGTTPKELWLQVLAGAGLGLLTVIVTQALDRFASWARRLNRGLQEMVGEQTTGSVIAIAVGSGVGEEVFFRGFLMQMMALYLFSSMGDAAMPAALVSSSLLFGLMHIGPDWKTFWPWTVMAIVMGAIFGGLFVWTGTLLAPIVAHFTINFFNLSAMSQQKGLFGSFRDEEEE